ncbi:IS1595 family transposase [Streptomyces caniscabiei]|uniref:IS1595 family transposase n=1 Tax=Streptomyces caniscabiei TaxID=2746961 RepID=UPI0029BCA7DE|nr:IS1595 family transposase [Streptomyces caniscabiei]MDX2776656.1 IS1595 family transposase [Streptomyces caniscabiei]
MEFQQVYGTEEACLTYLAEKRWGKDQKDRFCPHCGSYATYAFKNGKLYKCKDCSKQFTVKVGTIFTDSKVPLTKWFLAIYLATSLKKGISSVQLSKYAGVTQKTAWFMLQRIRYAIEDNPDGMLGGEVEVDETYVGGKPRAYEKGKRKPKAVVFGMIQRNGNIKVSHEVSSGARVLIPKIKENVRRGTIIYSDQWRAYSTLQWRQYTHLSVNHGELEFVRRLTHTQNIEAAWSHFKRSLIGVYHSVSIKHLQKYCSEFEYRYNTRTMDDKERFDAWFDKLHAHLPYKELVYGKRQG